MHILIIVRQDVTIYSISPTMIIVRHYVTIYSISPNMIIIVRHYVTIYSISPNIRVLVPGAGLGRLAHEIARLGFTCQGNEWSFYMLCAAHFVLNR